MMTLDNMRENGTRHIALSCRCGHRANVLVDNLAGDLAVPFVKNRFKCSVCGAKPFESRPAWSVRIGGGTATCESGYFKG